MEIVIALAIYIVGAAVEGLIADRAQKAKVEELVLTRLARMAGERHLGYQNQSQWAHPTESVF